MYNPSELGFSKHPSALSFIGKVVSNTDPHKRGRVKVVIPRWNEETELWAYPISPIMGGGTGTEASPSTDSWGFYGAPQVGDFVLLVAVDGDINTLVYLGCLNSKNQNLPEAKTNPDNLQLRMPSGHTLVFRTGADTSIELKTAGGDYIKLDDANSKIDVVSGSSSVTVYRNGDVDAVAGGNLNGTATGDVNFTGATINLN